MGDRSDTSWQPGGRPCCRCRILVAGIGAFLAGGFAGAASGEVTAEVEGSRAVVKVDGAPFAEYRGRFRHMPIIWPIYGPTGAPMTRQWPMGEALEHEEKDHPHHHSLWFAHQDVNGRDFWHQQDHDLKASEIAELRAEDENYQRQTGLEVVCARGDEEVVIRARTEWIGGPLGKICEDERTIAFGANDQQRWIDFTIRFEPVGGDLTFGDIKDGLFAVRVAGTMKVDAGLGGAVVNAEGLRDDDAWGRPSTWVDYYGPVSGQTVGLAMLSHPENFQHPVRWHVRSYGLFTANPFGERDFPKADIRQHALTVPVGESLTLRYRVVFHKGDAKNGGVAEAYQRFAGSAEPTP
ncbi:MAG: PmoA family protein [Planctomycetota bacterium]